MLPFSALVDAAHWIWQESERYRPLPVIPVAMAGWDSRPWNQLETVWYTRTPSEVAALVGDAIDWAEMTPRLRVPASPARPIVLIEAWNEIGEGGHLIPTVGEGCSYGAAVTGELLEGSSRARTVLTVGEAGPTASPREASGRLTTAAGDPIGGAPILLVARPTATDGPGIVVPYVISGVGAERLLHRHLPEGRGRRGGAASGERRHPDSTGAGRQRGHRQRRRLPLRPGLFRRRAAPAGGELPRHGGVLAGLGGHAVAPPLTTLSDHRRAVAMAEPLRRAHDRDHPAGPPRACDRPRRGTSSLSAAPLPSLLPRGANAPLTGERRARTTAGRATRPRRSRRPAASRWPPSSVHKTSCVASRQPPQLPPSSWISSKTRPSPRAPAGYLDISLAPQTTSRNAVGSRRAPPARAGSPARDPVMANDSLFRHLWAFAPGPPPCLAFHQRVLASHRRYRPPVSVISTTCRPQAPAPGKAAGFAPLGEGQARSGRVHRD